MTATEIVTDEESFQIVLDKGLLDSLVCCENGQQKVQQALVNVYKILQQGGSYVCVSRGAPDVRLGYLQQAQFKWTVKTVKIHKVTAQHKEVFERVDSDPFYYVYVCEKRL